MLKDLLKQNRSEIIQIWFDLIIETYPADSSNFFKQTKNRFGNPVGHIISKEIEPLYDFLLSETNNDENLFRSLNNIIKIRSVQDFTASQAVNFVFLLKQAIRKYLNTRPDRKQMVDELLDFELKIDNLALCAFDTYMKCKEKISEIRVNESRRKTAILLEKINLTSGNPEQTKE